MLKRILDATKQELVREERRRLGELRVLLVRLEAPPENQKALVQALAQLDELFLLVVVGEFNAGKSSLINALVGEEVLEEGVTPTTSRVGVLMYGPEVDRTPAGRGFEAITVPLDILREMHVVDTPGTNAVLREHEALTRDFVPRADLVLFVTSADRPFSESERAFLEALRAWGKKVIVILNKIDILERAEEIDRVVAFVKEKVLAHLGFRPSVFAVSARQAVRAKAAVDSEWYQASRFEALEQFLSRTLHETVRVRLKLMTPIGVGLRVLNEAASGLDQRGALLAEDLVLVDELEARLDKPGQESRDLRARLGEAAKPIQEALDQGRSFVDRRFRAFFVTGLLDREGTRARFDQEVADGLVQALDDSLEVAAEGVGDGVARGWQGLAERVERRRAVHAVRVGPLPAGAFEPDRARLVKELRREAQRVTDAPEIRGAGQDVARAGFGAALGTLFSLTVGVFLGLVAWIGSSTTAGLLLGLGGAAVVVSLGLGGLAFARKRAQAALDTRLGGLRERLTGALAGVLDRELDQGRQRVRAATDPYRRFVRGDGELMRSQRDELDVQRQHLEAIRARIESLR